MKETEVEAFGRILARMEQRHLDGLVAHPAEAGGPNNDMRLRAERDLAVRRYEQIHSARSVQVALGFATVVRRIIDRGARGAKAVGHRVRGSTRQQ